MQGKERIRAGFGVRAAAYLVDRLLLLLALGFIRVPALLVSLFTGGGISRAVLFQYSALDIVCYLLSALYFVLQTYLSGSTLGKKLFHLRVEGNDGEKLRFVDVLYRETVGRFLSGLLYIGYILALIDSRNRAFHDWLCDTRVVYDSAALRRVESDEETESGRYPA